MEPNTLATPNDALAGGHEWNGLTDRTARVLPLDGGSPAPEFGTRASTSTATVTSATSTVAPPATMALPIHRNGHDRNGHDGPVPHPAWSSVAISLPGGPAAVSLPALVVPRETRDGFYLRSGKRVFDVVGALAGLVVGLPVMALAALAIKLESRGPVLYRSKRIGRNGVPFTFIKMRSMVEDAERQRHQMNHLNETDGPVFKMYRDPRVTRVGRFLRTTSIDELPQLFNVLRGEMSLVGPRPPIPEEVTQYEPWQRHRLDVNPGLTCLWQISGRSRIGFQEWMRLDLEYIKHQSLALDLKILVRTLPAVLSREGAY
jgi:lipopolysaccharide/colanic/teichoic acid biosynthesis glycosyltransferase